MTDEPINAGERMAAPPQRRAVKHPAQAAPDVITPPPAPLTPPTVVEDGASVAAEHVELRQSAVGRVEANQVSVGQGAIGAARADQLTIDRGAVGAALGEHVEIRNGYARSILARQVQLDRAAARVVIAADVRTNQTAVMFLVARKVAGDVRVLLDWRGALAFGAAAGLVLALVRRGRRPAK